MNDIDEHNTDFSSNELKDINNVQRSNIFFIFKMSSNCFTKILFFKLFSQ